MTVSGQNLDQVFYIAGVASASVSGLTITEGDGGAGGGVQNFGTLTLTDDIITGNTAEDFGGGVWSDGTATLIGDTVSGNTVFQFDGGGLLNEGTMTLIDSTVSGNFAKHGDGGGLYDGGTMLTLMNTTISSNHASYGGGGLASEGDTVDLTNVTISGNSATTASSFVAGGGLLLFGEMATLTNCTISGNSAPTGGGVYVAGSLTLSNTIVAGNTNGSGAASDIGDAEAGAVTGSYNLIGSGGAGGLLAANHNLIGVANPLLAPLGNYGGPTQTMPALPGSPVINAGDNALAVDSHGNPLATDERGAPRIAGGTVDLGAVESQGFTLIPSSGTPQSTLPGTAFSLPLQAELTENGFNTPLPGANITFTGPSGGAGITTSPSATTGTGGIASVAVTANSLLGAYTVVASASGVATADFDLTSGLQPDFTGLTSATTSYGTPFTLSGTILAGGTVPTGSVSVTVGGVTQRAAIQSSGGFSANFTTTPGASAIPYTITYAFAAGGDFLGVTDTSQTLTVNKATPSLSVSAGAAVVLGTGVPLTASTTLAGGSMETGTITFTLYSPGNVSVSTDVVAVTGNGTYNTSMGTSTGSALPALLGTYEWVAAYSGDGNNGGGSAATSQLVIGTGVFISGTTLYIVGAGTNDSVAVNPAGAGKDGTTGLQVNANVDKLKISMTYVEPFTAIFIFGYGGNDSIQLAISLTLPATITEGAGNDSVELGNGASTVTLGNGNDSVEGGSGNDTVTVGNGNDSVQLGDGDNVIVEGNGNDSVLAGNGANLVVGGLGKHTIQLGNGNNILIDGSATVVNAGDSLRQILTDWKASSLTAVDLRLNVTYSTAVSSALDAGSGRDWFFYTEAKTRSNRKATDFLN